MPIVKTQKSKKELQIINKIINNKMNKTGKTKSLTRLSNLDLSEFMVENNIKSETELFAITDEQKKAEKKDLANFVLLCRTKALSELLENIYLEDRVCKQKSFLLKTNPHGSDSWASTWEMCRLL